MDRNSGTWALKQIPLTSLSARRAWIEIHNLSRALAACHVALRKESVDRNFINVARAADRILVALRKESVDRNY